MSQKRKRGLHDSLSDIIKRQNTPIDEKSKMSANLLANFAPAEKRKPASNDQDSNHNLNQEPQSSTQRQPLPVDLKTNPQPHQINEPEIFNKGRAAGQVYVASEARSIHELSGLKAQSYTEFLARWKPFLRPAQLSVCKAIWDMTYAVGKDECFSSMAKLAAAANLSERQCYRSVEQLEHRGLVERPEIFNTAKVKGTVFILHSLPVQSHLKRKRIYHVGE
jgi:hypothetical protein